MEMIGFFELDVRENALSCISCVFDESIGSDSSEDYSSSQADASGYRASNVTQEYIVIGTAHAEVDAVEPSKGRILVFDITNENGKKPVLVTEKEIKGAAFTLASINGRIAAGINSKVRFQYILDIFL